MVIETIWSKGKILREKSCSCVGQERLGATPTDLVLCSWMKPSIVFPRGRSGTPRRFSWLAHEGVSKGTLQTRLFMVMFRIWTCHRSMVSLPRLAGPLGFQFQVLCAPKDMAMLRASQVRRGYNGNNPLAIQLRSGKSIKSP